MATFEQKIEKVKLLFNQKELDGALKAIQGIKAITQAEKDKKNTLLAAIFVRKGNASECLRIIEDIEKRSNAASEETINIKGIALRILPDLQAAKEVLARGVKLYPKSVDLAHNLSVTAADMGDFMLAEQAALQALAIKPNYIETHKNLGRIYVTTRNLEKARNLFDKLNLIDPNSVDVLVGKGAIALLESNPQAAADFFEKALAIDDGLPAAWANLSICKKYLGDYEAAKSIMEIAIKKDPKQIENIWNLSLINLALGNFKEAWPQYEVRYSPKRNVPDAVKTPNTKIPQLGLQDSVLEKTVILVQEQGYGDTFQFFRFAKQLKDEGAKKIIAIVAKEMIEVICTIPWIDEIATELRNMKEVPDYWVFSMSLPLRYEVNSIESIPRFPQYLMVDGIKKQIWSSYLNEAGITKKLRVGLVWAGRDSHSNDANRSLKFVTIEPLLRMNADIDFISLQKGPREADIIEDKRLLPCGARIHNFADTASLMANLDLLISVDSAPVHLAGALGMPVWTLVPSIFDFRWLINREDSPWYPTMRLFRQAQGENWDAVIARVALQLQELVKSHKSRWQACEYQPHVELSVGETRPAGTQLLLQSAFRYHVEGGLQAARSMYELILTHNPNDLAALRNLAALYRAQGELQLSVQTYEVGDLSGIGDCIFYTNYANLLADLGRLDAAHDKLLMALKKNPNHEPALSALKRCIELKTKDTI